MGWGEPGMFRLSGTIPEGAERFEFAYGLVVDQYPLTLSINRDAPVIRWQVTGKRSEAFVLASLQPMTRLQVSDQYLQLGYTHIERGCPGRCWNFAAARVRFYATCSTSVASPRPRR